MVIIDARAAPASPVNIYVRPLSQECAIIASRGEGVYAEDCVEITG